MGVDQGWERFSNAIRFALVSDASLQERVRILISDVGHLQRDSFLDERVWDEFRKLVNAARRASACESDGATSQMSDKKAKECLQAAFDISSDLAKTFGSTEFVI